MVSITHYFTKHPAKSLFGNLVKQRPWIWPSSHFKLTTVRETTGFPILWLTALSSRTNLLAKYVVDPSTSLLSASVLSFLLLLTAPCSVSSWNPPVFPRSSSSSPALPPAVVWHHDVMRPQLDTIGLLRANFTPWLPPPFSKGGLGRILPWFCIHMYESMLYQSRYSNSIISAGLLRCYTRSSIWTGISWMAHTLLYPHTALPSHL